MEPWNMGIFTIMAVMVTVVGIVLASRFVYLDSRYNKIIESKEKEMQGLNVQRDEIDSDKIDSDGYDFNKSDIIQKQLIIASDIGEYKSKRADNRGIGIWIDVSCLSFIMALGIIATFGYFDNLEYFTFLVIFLILFFSIPLANFLLHVTYVNKYKSI